MQPQDIPALDGSHGPPVRTLGPTGFPSFWLQSWVLSDLELDVSGTGERAETPSSRFVLSVGVFHVDLATVCSFFVFRGIFSV